MLPFPRLSYLLFVTSWMRNTKELINKSTFMFFCTFCLTPPNWFNPNKVNFTLLLSEQTHPCQVPIKIICFPATRWRNYTANKRLYSSESLAYSAVQESRKVVGLIPALLCVVCMGWCGKRVSWFSSESQPEQLAVLRSDQGRSGSRWREGSPPATTDARVR